MSEVRIQQIPDRTTLEQDLYVGELSGSYITTILDRPWLRVKAGKTHHQGCPAVEGRKNGVKFHLVSGHMSIEGNEKADKTAEEVAEKAGT